jgi:hypothetical protein
MVITMSWMTAIDAREFSGWFQIPGLESLANDSLCDQPNLAASDFA